MHFMKVRSKAGQVTLIFFYQHHVPATHTLRRLPETQSSRQLTSFHRLLTFQSPDKLAKEKKDVPEVLANPKKIQKKTRDGS